MFEQRPGPVPRFGRTTADAALTARLRRLASEPAGPDAAAQLSGLEPSDLDDEQRVLLLQAWERVAAWVAARTQAAMVAVADAAPGPAADDWGREEVAAALRLSPATAYRRIRLARAMSGPGAPLAPTAELLGRGEITYLHAMVLEDVLARVEDPQVVADVQAVVLPKAPQQTVGALRRAAARALVAADPAGAADRHHRARAERRVVLYPEDDAMATLLATGPAPELLAVMHTLTEHAHQAETRLRAAGQPVPPTDARLLDALVDLLTDPDEPGAGGLDPAVSDPGVSHPATPDPAVSDPDDGRRTGRASRRRPVADVTIDLATLLGLAENPGHLPGYGPVPPALARRLAADADWRRLVTDPQTGHLLDRSPRTYRPGDALADYIRSRDQHCRFPGCVNPRVDLDHRVPFDDGGDTVRANLQALCRRHHRLKTESHWTVHAVEDPSGPTTGQVWTSPTGCTYRSPPPET